MYDRSVPGELNRLKRRMDQIAKGQRLAHGASIENAALEVRDDSGSLRAIYGQQADGTSGIQVVNGPPPPAPSTPIVASVLGGVTVSWDGQFADGAVIPLDWARVEVHASTSSGFTPTSATLQSTIETAQGATFAVMTDDPVYVQLLARNTSGAASPPSVEAGPYGPAPVVASDVLDGIITEVKLAADAVTAAKIAAGAVGTTEISDDAVTTQKIVAGAILAGQIAAGAVLTDKLAAEAVTAAKIAALAITTDKLDANAVTTSKLAAGSVDATAIKADAITGKAITGGTITGTDIIGSTVTGGTLRTGSTGARTVITPTPPVGIIQRPSVLMYSGVTGENWPAVFNSGESTITPNQAVTVLTAPMTGVDSTGATQTSQLTMLSAKPGTFGASTVLGTSNNPGTSDTGYARLTATSAATTSDTSFISLTAKDGSDTGKQSTVYTTGDHVTITANGSGHVFSSSGLSVAGAISARNTPSFVYKTTSTDRASTTTLADDPDLVGTFIAGETYLVELHLLVGAGTTGLMTTAWKVPSGATGLKAVHGPSSVAAGTDTLTNAGDNITGRFGSHAFTTTVTYGRRNANSNLLYAIETGIVTMGATTGTFALQWTQSASSATATRMGVGSWVRFTRLSP
ncbi:hypothetical protein ACFYXD_35030 [Streptomyces platensis]|uniref:hypothetical protein n=1 Tax=Streptomyces platensis TaxID=58346 RepID=UPI0036CDB46E